MRLRWVLCAMIVIASASAIFWRISQVTKKENWPDTQKESVSAKTEYKQNEENELNLPEQSETLEPMEELTDEMREGDSGEEIEAQDIYTTLDVDPERSSKSGFQKFILEYTQTQHYTNKGWNFDYASKENEEGVSENDSAARVSGMGNPGYIVWLLRNAFGGCDVDYLNPFLVYQKSEKIDQADLEIGDLGFIYDEDRDDNFMGICAGFSEGKAVFSLMDGSWSEKFPFGSNRLCYLKSESDEYIGTSSPVNFRFFCRPQLPWVNTDEDKGIDLAPEIEEK